MDYFLKNNIITKNIVLYHKGCRDDPTINVYKDLETGAIVLDKIKEQNYETQGLDYWYCKNIDEARKSTYDDDFRRYNQLKSINSSTLLDFGCGNGGLLKILKEKEPEKNILGVELNNELVNHLNSENITAYNHISKIPINLKLDCIMLNHVLEHFMTQLKGYEK